MPNGLRLPGLLLTALLAAPAFAQGTLAVPHLLDSVLSSVIFGVIGIVLAIAGFKLFDAIIPFKLEEEICQRQNVAVAILCAAVIIGISIVVAAAIFG